MDAAGMGSNYLIPIRTYKARRRNQSGPSLKHTKNKNLEYSRKFIAEKIEEKKDKKRKEKKKRHRVSSRSSSTVSRKKRFKRSKSSSIKKTKKKSN